MAFSKAKLLRFNDIKTCAPPPGAYNPKYKEPVVGAVIPQSERFADPRSPGNSTCSESHSVCSSGSVPTFRTPTKPPLHRKKILPYQEDKKSSKSLFSPKKSEALREKIVECINKDITIKELEGQIEEMKETIGGLRSEQAGLAAEKKGLLAQLEENKKAESALKCLEERLADAEARNASLQSQLLIKSEELKSLQSQVEEGRSELQELQQQHISEIRSLNKLHVSEVQDLEYELLKTVTEWRKVVENMDQENKSKIGEIQQQRQAEIYVVQENCARQLRQIRSETEAQLKQANENCCEKVKLAEIQMEETRKELEADWALRLRQQQDKSDEILKECQSISEYSIIQCELEKNDIASRLKQEKQAALAENARLQETVSQLRADMTALAAELSAARDQLARQSRSHQADLEHAEVQQHGYKVTLSKTHETINALKKRLLDSDRDVEQLKLEIENTENCSLGSENKICCLENELQQASIVKQTLQVENSRLKFELDHKVKTIEEQLLGKVDAFQAKADERIEQLNEVVVLKSEKLCAAMDRLHEQQGTIAQAQALLAQAEDELNQRRANEGLLREQLAALEHSVTGTLQDKTDDLLKQLKWKDEEISSLRQLVKDQNALIGPFREQLEHYERDYKLLLNDKQEAEQEMKEMSLKYAEILGHQNKKQKIKYMVDLKKKNLQLQESKSEYEARLFKQSLLIDGLRHEVKVLQQKNEKKQRRRSRSLISADKENLHSPLKDRN